MKLLIVGDSFASDWAVKYKDKIGWPNMLSNIFNTMNLAESGVSEYKILKQIESVDITQFNAVVISHTSFSRVHTKQHPFYKDDPLHFNCDLILSDIETKKDLNPSAKAAWDYYKYHFDDIYYKDIYNLIREKIDFLTKDIDNCISINNFHPKEKDISFRELLSSHKGDINHFNKEGNEIVFNYVLNHLRSKLGKR